MSVSPKGIKFGYGVQTNFATPSATATGGVRTRREGGLPDFKTGHVPASAPSLQGYWGDRDNESKTGYSAPTFSYPGYAVISFLLLCLNSVMTATAAGSGWTYALKSGTAYVPTATAFLSLFRKNDLATAQDKRLAGCVPKSIKLSGSFSQQRVNMDVEFLAGAYADGATYAGTYTVPADTFLLHSGMTFKIGAAATQCAEWDLSLDFGTSAILDNAAAPSEMLLGPLSVEGSVKIPWADDDAINDFQASTGNTLTFLWGVAASSGYLEIVVPVKYQEEPSEDEGEARIRSVLPFKYAETTGQALTVALQV